VPGVKTHVWTNLHKDAFGSRTLEDAARPPPVHTAIPVTSKSGRPVAVDRSSERTEYVPFGVWIPYHYCSEIFRDLFSQSRDHIEKVSDHTVVSLLKDGRILILIDGNNHFGGAHAGQMLNGT